MGNNSRGHLDDTDWKLLELLQADARLSYSELGRQVSMSAPAVTERVRRLEELGIITGYRAMVDLARLGVGVRAVVRVRTFKPEYERIFAAMSERPEIRECHHVTGDDCMVLHVACRDMKVLEETVGFLNTFGATTTSVVFSTPIADLAVGPELAAAHFTPTA